MARNQPANTRRDREFAALRGNSRQNPSHDGRGRLVLLRGPAGMGRTTLLAEAMHGWRADGVRVLSARGEHGDRFGVATLQAALGSRVEHVGASDLVQRLRELAESARAELLPRVTVEVGALFEKLAADGPVALLVDDVDRVAVPAPVLLAARRGGCLVVAACRSDVGPSHGLADLVAVVDDVIDMARLTDAEIDAILAKHAGQQLDPALFTALRAALGPLFGNPGTALATLRDLDEQGRLVAHRDRMCLRDPAVPIGLPAEHPLLDRVRQLGELAQRLVAVVAASGEFDADGLPLLTDMLGADLPTCGRMLDVLVEDGIVVADGFLVVPRCAALAVSVLDAVGGAAAVHARLAGALAGSGRWSRLAEHIAGGNVVPDDPSWLVALARELETTDPSAALRHCLTVLRSPAHANAVLVNKVLALTIRIGHYDWVYRVDASWPALPAGLPAEVRAGLRCVARLAIVHTGQTLSEAGNAWFDVDSGVDNADLWWFGDGALTGTDLAVDRGTVRPIRGRADHWPVISAAELRLVRAALAGNPDAGARLLGAGQLGDIAAVLESVLGERYSVPETGPVAAYHRLLTAYHNGNWSNALSSARELELGASTGRWLGLARLFASEICARQGESARARRWLGNATSSGPLRSWVSGGLAWLDGDARGAVEMARAAAVDQYGVDRLLARGVAAAVDAGDRTGALGLLRRLESLHDRRPEYVDELSLVLARAIAYREPASALAALRMARESGWVYEQIIACLTLAELADDQAAELLGEAYQLAQRAGAAPLRRKALDRIRALGAAKPDEDDEPAPFSPTELRVIAMVRCGHTNRRIASTLRIRPKTAENYLTRLLAKTGSRSRVELITASRALINDDECRIA